MVKNLVPESGFQSIAGTSEFCVILVVDAICSEEEEEEERE